LGFAFLLGARRWVCFNGRNKHGNCTIDCSVAIDICDQAIHVRNQAPGEGQVVGSALFAPAVALGRCKDEECAPSTNWTAQGYSWISAPGTLLHLIRDCGLRQADRDLANHHPQMLRDEILERDEIRFDRPPQ
jgi:hypothetical protein